MPFVKTTIVLAATCAALTGAASPAVAKCTRLAFSVNDYGKDGPTKDAKALLDKYIANWMAERGIKSFNVGKKDVTCELFLDFGVFDEHTCKAAATVCWPDGQKTATPRASSDGIAPRSPVSVKKAADAKSATPMTTGSVAKPQPATKAD